MMVWMMRKDVFLGRNYELNVFMPTPMMRHTYDSRLWIGLFYARYRCMLKRLMKNCEASLERHGAGVSVTHKIILS